MTRAAVVYLRHWRQFGDQASRDRAYQLLRGVTYLQTSSGPDAGNVVLWMQPDGTLNTSPTPTEEPDPSDSGPSYWLARTIWALGEGYAAFRAADPAFAGFLRERLELSLYALDRQVLDPRYGTYQTVDGLRLPAWLIVDGADASSEAVYGLAAYVRAGGSARARLDLRRLADGVARMPLGDVRDWPYGALLPWARSRSLWHAWGDQMAGSLAEAGRENGWLPAPTDRVPDRLRGRRHPPEPAPDRGRRPAARLRRPGRDRRGLVLRQQPGRGGHVRPGHRADLRRHQPRPDGQPQLGRRVDHPRPAVDAGPRRPSGGRGQGPGRGTPGPGHLAAGRGRGRHPGRRGRGRHPGLGLDGGERLERRGP